MSVFICVDLLLYLLQAGYTYLFAVPSIFLIASLLIVCCQTKQRFARYNSKLEQWEENGLHVPHQCTFRFLRRYGSLFGDFREPKSRVFLATDIDTGMAATVEVLPNTKVQHEDDQDQDQDDYVDDVDDSSETKFGQAIDGDGKYEMDEANGTTANAESESPRQRRRRRPRRVRRVRGGPQGKATTSDTNTNTSNEKIAQPAPVDKTKLARIKHKATLKYVMLGQGLMKNARDQPACSWHNCHRSLMMSTGVMMLVEKMGIAVSIVIFYEDILVQLILMIAIRVFALMWLALLRPYVSKVRTGMDG